jgi:hypothetical protein
MVRRIEAEGWTARAVADASAVSERTVRKWLARYRAEGLIGLKNRSSRTRVVANKLAASLLAMILRLRKYRLTRAELPELLNLPRTTVAGDLQVDGLSRLTLLDRKPAAVRYQREWPGELVHLDVKKLDRFDRVGHRITGRRRGQSSGVGWDFVHVAVDDASRLAHVEFSRTNAARRQPAFSCGHSAGFAPAAFGSSAS